MIPTLFIAVKAEGLLLAKADHMNPALIDSLGNQVGPGRESPPFTEGEVVIVGSTLIAMPLNCNSGLRMSPQVHRVLLENRLGGGIQVVLIGRKVNVL